MTLLLTRKNMCMKYNQYDYNYVKQFFEENGDILLSKNYKTCKDILSYENSEGYRFDTCFDKYKNRPHARTSIVHPSNSWSIYNINHWAILHGIKSKCISESYEGASKKLSFICECGERFFASWETFSCSGKTKCDMCTGYTGHKIYDDVKKDLLKQGFYLDTPKSSFLGVTTSSLVGHDSEGYKYRIVYDAAVRGEKFEKFSKGNPFSIDNINLYLKKKNCHFKCISPEYTKEDVEYKFSCLLCGNLVMAKWSNVNRNDNASRHCVSCPNCDGRTESLHAIVLKQLFAHYEPDTIMEDPSFINPNTHKPMPTDIVNHRLKIAIEIQSHWHDFPDKVERDKMKKQYWIDKGYAFYDPDIRDYSVIEMARLFFDINEIPSFVDLNIANKINIKKVQQSLNDGLTLPEISRLYNIRLHRLHDAIAAKKIFYPTNYVRGDYTPIIQFDSDWNYLAEYDSIKQAAEQNNLKAGNISSALYHGKNYSGGYYWIKKKDYKK